MSRPTSDHQRCARAKALSASPPHAWKGDRSPWLLGGQAPARGRVWQTMGLEIVRHQQSLRMSAAYNSGRPERRSMELKVEEEPQNETTCKYRWSKVKRLP